MTTAYPLLQKMFDVLLGAQPGEPVTQTQRTDPTPAWAQATSQPAQVTATRGLRALKRNEVAPEAFKRAMEDFLNEEVEPYVRYNPNTRYRIDQISTYVTADNKAILSDLESLKRVIRNGIGQACIRQVPNATTLLEMTEGCEWKIDPAPDASSDDRGIYTVLAGNGPEQCGLTFVFYGDYVPYEPAAEEASTKPSPKSTPTAITADADADQTPTFELTLKTERVGPSIDMANTPPVLRLRITEAGQPSRQFDASNLPLLLGRGSACGVQLRSPYMSRIHACIRLSASGQLVLESNSAKGTRLETASGTKDLALGQHAVLPMEGSFTLAAAADDGATHIEFEQCHTEADAQPTLNVADVYSARTDASQRFLAEPKYTPMPVVADFGTGGVQDDDAAPATFYFSNDTPAGTGGSKTAAKQEAKALARLWVCHADGSLSSDLIYQLPHVVGREPKQAHATKVHDPAARASREHLLIEKMQGTAFLTDNLAFAPGKGGTWSKTRSGNESISQRFAWQPSQPGAQEGWLELGHQHGQDKPDGQGELKIVRVKLERVL